MHWDAAGILEFATYDPDRGTPARSLAGFVPITLVEEDPGIDSAEYPSTSSIRRASGLEPGLGQCSTGGAIKQLPPDEFCMTPSFAELSD